MRNPGYPAKADFASPFSDEPARAVSGDAVGNAKRRIPTGDGPVRLDHVSIVPKGGHRLLEKNDATSKSEIFVPDPVFGTRASGAAERFAKG
ncbi:hypothetical protein MKK50_18590 [Methylobacterium sp. J-043]|nr:hypothetical protein [Methylobacterium sp. J-043]